MCAANRWTLDGTSSSTFREGEYDSTDSSPLGIVIPGYPVTTNTIPIDPARWVFPLDTLARDFVVFLTPAGLASLPSTCGIGVYVSIPFSGDGGSDSAAPLYHYVGCLRADTPSGLFTLSASLLPDYSVPLSAATGSRSEMMSGNERNGGTSNGAFNGNAFSLPSNAAGNRSFFPSCSGEEAGKNSTGMTPPAAMVIGLSMEPIELLNSLSEAPLRQQAESTVTKVAMAEKILENFYSFVSSYGKVLKPSYFFSPPSVASFPSPSAPLQMYDGTTQSGSALATNGVPTSSPYVDGLAREREAFLTSLFGPSATRAVEGTAFGDPLYSNGASGSSVNAVESSGTEFIVMPMNFVNKWRERLQKILQKDRSFFNS